MEKVVLSDIDQLIKWLEEEKIRLHKMITSAAEEWEFSEAHSHAEAYRKVNLQLQILKHLKTPDFALREFLYNRLITIERFQKEKLMSFQSGFYEAQLADLNRQLDDLESKHKVPRLDTQFIDDALFDLVKANGRPFRIHLIKEDGIYLHFDMIAPHVLEVSFTPMEGLPLEIDYDEKITNLRSLGFDWNPHHTQLTKTFNVEEFRDALAIKQWLARIVFDVFEFFSVDKEMVMEFF